MQAENQRTPEMGGTSLASGVRVQLWGSSTKRWVPGYQIVAASPRGYVVRCISDHAVLRRLFAERDVRVDPIPLPPPGWTPRDAA